MYVNDKLYVNITYKKRRRVVQDIHPFLSIEYNSIVGKKYMRLCIETQSLLDNNINLCLPFFLISYKNNNNKSIRYFFVVISFKRHVIVKIRKKSQNHLKRYIIIKIFTETISCFRIEFVKASTHRLRSSSPSAPTVKLKFVCPVDLRWLITSETEKGFRGKSSRTGVAVVAYVASWSNTVLIDRRQALLGVKPLLRRSKYKSPWLHYEYIYTYDVNILEQASFEPSILEIKVKRKSWYARNCFKFVP